MATVVEVRNYLARWFQLGKGIVIHTTGEVVRPKPVIQGDRYSPEFEACWQKVMSHAGEDCGLEGTDQTVSNLLSNEWDILDCARCNMPIPSRCGFMFGPCCPCQDMPSWPDLSVPIPQQPVLLQSQLKRLHERIQAASKRYAEIPQRSHGTGV